MNRKQLLEQVRLEQETLAAQNTAQSDTAFYKAYAKDRTLTRAKFDMAHKDKKTLSVGQLYTKKLIEQCDFKSSAPRSFDANAPSAEQKKIYSALATYCKKFPDVKTPNIVLSGATGTGKTYISHILANNLLDSGFWVEYTTAFGMVNAFQKYIASFGADDAKLDAFLECNMLVIDDLGAEPVIKNITSEHIYNIINERLVHGRAFVITTNLSPEAIFDRYDQRIASRILSKETSTIIEVKGKDLRLV